MPDSSPSPKLLSVSLQSPERFAFNAANTLLAVGSRKEEVGVILDLADGREIGRIEGIALRDLEAFQMFGDNLLTIQNKACILFDVRRKKVETVFAKEGVYPQGATIDPTGRLLAIGIHGGVILYDLRRRRIRHKLETYIPGAPLYPTFSPGGQYVAADFITEASGCFLLVWDIDGKRWRTLELSSSQDVVVAFRGDSPDFVLGQYQLSLHESGQGDEPTLGYARPTYPAAAAFRDRNKILAALGHQGELVLLDAGTGTVKREIKRPSVPMNHSTPSPDWSRIASSTEQGAHIWPTGLKSARDAKRRS